MASNTDREMVLADFQVRAPGCSWLSPVVGGFSLSDTYRCQYHGGDGDIYYFCQMRVISGCMGGGHMGVSYGGRGGGHMENVCGGHTGMCRGGVILRGCIGG